MKRLSASLLAIGLAAGSGLASAQSHGNNGCGGDPAYQGQGYAQPANGGYYDYARVVRVDPVVGSGYGNGASSRRCWQRERPRLRAGRLRPVRQRLLRPVRQLPPQRFRRQRLLRPVRQLPPASGGSNTGRTVATVVGGIAGAVLGSKIGGGTGSVAASAIGTMVGGMAGRQVYDNAHRQQRTATVSVCDPVPVNDYYGGANNAVTAYDVTYEYAGRRYTTRTGYNPGDRIRVRVDVHPE